MLGHMRGVVAGQGLGEAEGVGFAGLGRAWAAHPPAGESLAELHRRLRRTFAPPAPARDPPDDRALLKVLRPAPARPGPPQPACQPAGRPVAPLMHLAGWRLRRGPTSPPFRLPLASSTRLLQAKALPLPPSLPDPLPDQGLLPQPRQRVSRRGGPASLYPLALPAPPSFLPPSRSPCPSLPPSLIPCLPLSPSVFSAHFACVRYLLACARARALERGGCRW